MGGSPLLFPFTTPLLLFITAGFGLLLGKNNNEIIKTVIHPYGSQHN
jgi:hypothetical protein